MNWLLEYCEFLDSFLEPAHWPVYVSCSQTKYWSPISAIGMGPKMINKNVLCNTHYAIRM